MAGDAGEGGVELELLLHGGYGAGEDVDIAAGVVTAEGGLGETESGFDYIERVADAAGFAEEHFRDVDGIDAGHFSRGASASITGGGEKFRVESQSVVGDQRAVTDPCRKRAHHFLRAGRTDYVMIADASVAFDEAADATSRSGKAKKLIFRDHAAIVVADSGDLNEIIGIRIESGGFEVVNYK